MQIFYKCRENNKITNKIVKVIIFNNILYRNWYSCMEVIIVHFIVKPFGRISRVRDISFIMFMMKLTTFQLHQGRDMFDNGSLFFSAFSFLQNIMKLNPIYRFKY